MPADDASAASAATGTACPAYQTDPLGDALDQIRLSPVVAGRVLHVRCAEARAQRAPSQDYVALDVAPDGRALAFCVCDGVGSSYRADVAASFLAQRLVAALLGDGFPDDADADAGRLASWTTDLLRAWAADGRAALAAESLPSDQPAVVREVLAELRERHGAEAVFRAGLLVALGGGGAPWEHARLSLLWMGNVTAEVYAGDGPPEAIGPAESDADRWSTHVGPRGMLRAEVRDVAGLRRLIVATDGLATVAHEVANLDDAALIAEAERLLQTPTNDDMTVLDLRWDAESTERASTADGAPEAER